jgi:hypothetical protein
MTKLVPNRFLFDFEFILPYRRRTPSFTDEHRNWTDEELLPNFGSLDGEEPFAQVWACWNEKGLAIACDVPGKRTALRCHPPTFWKGDNLRLCTDMRDTRNIRRASKYCQQFYFLPSGGGGSKAEPVAGSASINRAREVAPAVPRGRIAVVSQVCPDRYRLEAHIPGDVLYGFDPAEHPRIGFYYILEDTDHGQQFLTVGDDLQWHIDPSTWATAVLDLPGER